MTKITLFHGTTADKISSILRQGIVNKTNDPNWYMLASNFGSALFHCNADKYIKAVVIEVHLTLPEVGDNVFWNGYPALYPEYKHDNADISWFAPNEVIKPECIAKVHVVELESFLAQKSNGFLDINSYKKKTFVRNAKPVNCELGLG